MGEKMEQYKKIDGDITITGYDLGTDSITVHFSDGSVSIFSYQNDGANNVEQMKSLARSGSGLGNYIKDHVNKYYNKKLK
jgi:hypothetical protein